MSRNFELLQQVGRDSMMNSTDVPAVEPEYSPPGPFVCHQAKAVNLPQMGEQSREQVAKLVRQLFHSPGAGRVVVVAGIDPGNGGTWVSLQCARVLAEQTSGAVCLIDGNLRNPALHDYFEVSSHHGLTDLIREGGSFGEYVHRIEGTRNLWLLSCGTNEGKYGPGSLLNAPVLRARMQELRAAFEYVVVDAPSPTLCGDCSVLGQAADGVLLVIAEQDTRKESARNAIAELNRANVRVLGAVLNKRTFPIPQRIYDRL
jgi:Mrp family chromosome partitioning ATPase